MAGTRACGPGGPRRGSSGCDGEAFSSFSEGCENCSHCAIRCKHSTVSGEQDLGEEIKLRLFSVNILIYFYNQFPTRGLTIPRIIVYRLMNRQELFHGDLHLVCVSRADQGYRGASRIFPFPVVTPMNPVKSTWNVTFSHTLINL